MSRLAILSVCFFLATPAQAAGNAPEGAQRSAEEDYLRKINLACSTELRISYEGDSLRKLNQDIGYDQTGGGNECNEPLRYVWYACKSEAGKAAVKAARLSQIVCKGVAGKTGSLTVQGGTVTVARAFEEEKPFVRSRRQFEAALKLSLPLPEPGDPYYDGAWSDLRQQPNPVTDTKNYCLVNGKKIELTDNAEDSFHHRKEDATVKCYQGGQLVTDLVLKQGRRSGFVTRARDAHSSRESYRDDKLHGEQRRLENGQLKSLTLYADGERVWDKEYYPGGRLHSYSRTLPKGMVSLRLAEDGKVQSLSCAPELKDDVELRKWCGFAGAITVSIYDGTGKVSRIVTYKDGVLQKEAAGDSNYARGSEVAYKNGKKHGEERLLDKNGRLTRSVSWDEGVQDGKERVYAEDGKKVIEELVWKKGEVAQRTELYLNGNPKLVEIHESATRMQRRRYWDTGKLQEEGLFLRAEVRGFGYRRNDWQEEGVHKRYFESGAPQEETRFAKGQREGTRKSWWDSGKQESVEEYADGKRTKARAWDKDGKLVLDEEYEADGSRKLKR